jgi:ADP-ribose pyrophosphatase
MAQKRQVLSALAFFSASHFSKNIPEDFLSSEKIILGAGKYLRLVCEGTWEYSERINSTGIVALIPITAQREIVLVEQYRVPTKAMCIELPAGLVGDIAGQEAESLELAAGRELEEETGFRAGKLEKVLEGPSSAGSSNSDITFYLATDLQRTGPGGGDAHEDITVHIVPLVTAKKWLDGQAAQGKRLDSKVFAGLYFASLNL